MKTFLIDVLFLSSTQYKLGNITLDNETITAISTAAATIIGIIIAIYAIRSYLGSKKVFRQERFENKFYELIKLHKANVDEMHIEDKDKTFYRGRECFVPMFKELKNCYGLVEKASAAFLEENKNTPDEIMSFSYKIFFYGLYSKSEEYYKNNLVTKEAQLITAVKLEYHRKPSELYLPLKGQVHRLGHYYRHLFQTVCFVVEQKKFNQQEKYNYLKTLRAQLSDYEQLLLYYNALAWFPEQWHEIFVKYKFIKNIPLPLTKGFYIEPHEYFAKEIEEYGKRGDTLFEYDE